MDSKPPAAEHPWFTTDELIPQTRLMNQLHQDQGVAKVADHQREKSPAFDRVRTEPAVDGAHFLLRGNPIRDYVPVPVQRTAKNRLKAMTAGVPAPLSGD